MKITSIEKYKGDTFRVIIDGNKKVYLHREIIQKFSLEPSCEIKSETLTEILYASDLRRASRRAMYLINERDYSYIQLFERLHKNYPDDICFKVVNQMAEKGYINDRRYADEIVYSYMICKCYGPRRVKQELYKRGVKGQTAETALENASEGLYERLLSVIEKKYADYLDDPDDKRAVDKVKNALVRMGYDYSDINSAINDFFDK